MKKDSKNKLKFKNVLSILKWTIGLGFKISPFYYTLTFLTILIQNIKPIFLSFFSSLILQELISSIAENRTTLSTNIIIFLGLWIFTGIVSQTNNLLNNYFFTRLNHKFDQMLMVFFLEKKSKIDIQHLENPDVKIIEEKARESISWRFRQANVDVFRLVSNIISLVFLGGIFLTINPIFILLVSIPVVINFLTSKKFGGEIYGIYNFKGDEKKHSYHAQESLDNLEVLKESKIYNFGGFLIKKYKDSHEKFTIAVSAKLKKKSQIQIGSVVIDNIIFGFIQIWLILQALAKNITVGNYSFYLLSINQVAGNLYTIEEEMTEIFDLVQYLNDYKNFLSLGDIVTKPMNAVKLESKAPEIEFRNVSFKYPNSQDYILKNVSFKINSGQKISLVGENGAGKSTIIKLLARFYDVTDGEILINGYNIKEIDLKEYYKLWGVLFQYFAKYWFTLRENIGIGNLEDIENKDLIVSAGNRAGLDSILEKLPHKYENMLSTDFKDGKDLSGGEWQKVGIARGLFANPKFIVLDEPTSALDALAEARVFEEIEHIAKDTTMLIVSHRFATVRNADRIIVLENGQISEQGSHEELIDMKGLYFNMFTTQAEGYK